MELQAILIATFNLKNTQRLSGEIYRKLRQLSRDTKTTVDYVIPTLRAKRLFTSSWRLAGGKREIITDTLPNGVVNGKREIWDDGHKTSESFVFNGETLYERTILNSRDTKIYKVVLRNKRLLFTNNELSSIYIEADYGRIILKKDYVRLKAVVKGYGISETQGVSQYNIRVSYQGRSIRLFATRSMFYEIIKGENLFDRFVALLAIKLDKKKLTILFQKFLEDYKYTKLYSSVKNN